MDRKEIAKRLYLASYKFLMTFWRASSCMNFREVHLEDKYRADVLSIAYDDTVTIIELKSCKEDFERDNKWKNYLDYCHRFWFMCPSGAIKPEDLPENIGLIWVSTGDDITFEIKKKSSKLKGLKLTNEWYRKLYKKLAFRKIIQLNGKLINIEEKDFFRV